MISGGTKAVVLLGAQRFDPTLREAVDELGVKGKIATITAGWQEREDDDDDLDQHLDNRAINLMLHARAEAVFKEDAELLAAHRERQALLRLRQDFYRVRLEHALDAATVIENRSAPPEILGDEARTSIEAIRNIDALHLERCAKDRADWDERVKVAERRAVARHRKELRSILDDCEAIAIAGGHVASLLNRLQLFDVGELAKGKVVFAWCGGAMAVTERVVLFHDSPPQGMGAPEVLDAGLAFVGDVVALPQPEVRLRLDDRERLRLLARRFQPATCIAMPARSRVTWLRTGPTGLRGAFAIREDGSHAWTGGRPAEIRSATDSSPGLAPDSIPGMEIAPVSKRGERPS
ncbi:MAG: hypothetical protein JST00_15830 [Deltaproteobacteria bacterium]|nr:hypothetical protein [Deltaproteobacteria bacterium]